MMNCLNKHNICVDACTQGFYSLACLDCRKGPLFTTMYQMYNVQVMDHIYYEYRCIITINVFSEAHNMNQVCIT